MRCQKCWRLLPDGVLLCPFCGNTNTLSEKQPLPFDKTRKKDYGKPFVVTDKPKEINTKGCLVFAIFMFIFCSKLFGIIAWGYAKNAIKNNDYGDTANALECRKNSFIFSFISLGVFIFFNIISFALSLWYNL